MQRTRLHGEPLETRAIQEALFLVNAKATTRDTGKHFGVSKTTITSDLAQHVKPLNPTLYDHAIRQMYANKHPRLTKQSCGYFC